MINVPATTEGLPAVRMLLDEGIGSDVAAGLAALPTTGAERRRLQERRRISDASFLAQLSAC